VKKTVQALLLVALLGSPLISKAAVSDNSTHSTEQHIHEDVKTEYIDIVEPNGEYVVADGKIQVKIDETGKVVSVDNLKPNKIKVEFVDIINGELTQCYVSTDGLGSNGMIAPTNEFGKLQTVSQVIVHYSAIPFVSPSVRIDHDHETEFKFTVQNLQPSETVIQQQDMKDVFKIEVDENGLYYTITLLDKCYEIVYIHDTNHREIIDGSGVIKNLPVNDEVIVYINMKDICKPDVKPELTPETPDTPEEPKLPEFLPDTGLQGLAYGVIGLGLVGVGLVGTNKKRK
jgi:uncharacterized protein YuzE